MRQRGPDGEPLRSGAPPAAREGLAQALAKEAAPAVRREWLARIAWPLALIVLMLAAWEAGVRGLGLPRYILPAPTLIAQTLWAKWPIFAAHTAVTLQEVAGGGALGAAVGVVLALAMFFFAPLEKALYPLLVASQNVPVFAIAPLLVLWFGYGYLPKVFMAAIIVFFPITVSALDGLKRTDPDWVRLFRTMGASPAQILWKLRVPAALPALFSGLKIGAIYSTIGAVIGEWVGAGAGLGYLMLSANAQLRVAEVFGAILCLTPIGLALLGGVVLVERRVLAWQRLRLAEEDIWLDETT
jgi:ABC-type nitrate/sulfonate/bicarbonate transport system permease component